MIRDGQTARLWQLILPFGSFPCILEFSAYSRIRHLLIARQHIRQGSQVTGALNVVLTLNGLTPVDSTPQITAQQGET